MIAFAIGSAVYGKISDMYGVKKLLIIGLSIYSGGSLFGLLTQASFPAVIVARVIQGAGASAVPALIMVIVARFIKAENRGKAFGMVGSMVAMGEGIGPAHKGKVDVFGALLLSIGVVLFTLSTTEDKWFYMLISLVLFLIFSLYTVAGFISMVPYMMRDVHQLSTGMIGGGILFPGTLSVIFFGILGGNLVDKRGNKFVLYLGVFFFTLSFIVISLFVDKTPWQTSIMLILTFGGLSFVKTVISSSVAETLVSEEVGAGMGMLNLACFLSEGIGVAIVGGAIYTLTYSRK
ncbi:hypothetical protein C2W64_00173 [Brevibacillus laterosporus]|nr:hypothetical protein C2W64_00173 [Brevibacillus laterosporus]